MVSEVVVKYNGTDYKVTIGKLTYGQRNKIIHKCTKVHIVDGKMKGEVKFGQLEREVVLASIKDITPKVNDIAAFLDSLDYDEAQKITAEATKINPLLT